MQFEEKKRQENKRIVDNSGAKEVVSPIQGQVTNIKVKVGDKVQKGDVLLIVEAMKLENEVVSPFEGQVAEILVTKGQNVKAKDSLIRKMLMFTFAISCLTPSNLP